MPSSFGLIPHTDLQHLGNAKRANDGGVAGLYGCNTLLHQHITPKMETYEFTRPSSSWGSTNVDTGAGVYSAEVGPYSMKCSAGVTAGDSSRVVIANAFGHGGNFAEVSALIQGFEPGSGYGNVLFVGAVANGADLDPDTAPNGFGFFCLQDGVWNVWSSNDIGAIHFLPVSSFLGREVQAGDLLTSRLYRQEGSSNIDSVAWYVNGQRLEYLEGPYYAYIPGEDFYPLFGAYALTGYANPTALCWLQIRRFMFTYNP